MTDQEDDTQVLDPISLRTACERALKAFSSHNGECSSDEMTCDKCFAVDSLEAALCGWPLPLTLQEAEKALDEAEPVPMSEGEIDKIMQRVTKQSTTFSQRNRRRCESPDGFKHPLDSWSLSDWLVATVGELGEAANVIKKLNRHRDGIPHNKETETELRAKLQRELGDTAVCLDLIAQAAGYDLETIREEAFVAKSLEIGYVEPVAGTLFSDWTPRT
jgi:NTP pyrophosphatase (non-canonical NTP hydrolase)